MIHDPPVTVESFQFSPTEPVAYEWSYDSKSELPLDQKWHVINLEAKGTKHRVPQRNMLRISLHELHGAGKTEKLYGPVQNKGRQRCQVKARKLKAESKGAISTR